MAVEPVVQSGPGLPRWYTAACTHSVDIWFFRLQPALDELVSFEYLAGTTFYVKSWLKTPTRAAIRVCTGEQHQPALLDRLLAELPDDNNNDDDEEEEEGSKIRYWVSDDEEKLFDDGPVTTQLLSKVWNYELPIVSADAPVYFGVWEPDD